jgi:hypothetical protein
MIAPATDEMLTGCADRNTNNLAGINSAND